MADTPHNTSRPAAGTSNMLTADRLEMRKALDLYFAALRADWLSFEGRAKQDGKASALAQDAAVAWAACTVALQQVSDLPGADPEIHSAAEYLLRSIPEEAPTEQSLHRLGTEVLKRAKDHKKQPSGLWAMWEEAFCLLTVYSANLAVMSLHRPQADPGH